MLAATFSLAMFLVTLYCAFMALSTWRNPENWHIDGDTKDVEFHAWLDIGIFSAVGAVSLLVAMIGLLL